MCWDQIVEGYLILNTGEKSEGWMLHTQQNSEYECLKSATNEVINAIVSPLGESWSPVVLFIGWLGGLVTMSERPP